MIKAYKNEATARRPLRRLALALAVPLLLGACSAVNGWMSQDEAPSKMSGDAQAEASAAEFPNLASVPDSAPSATSAETQKALKKSLEADRANAEYSGSQTAGGTASDAAMNVNTALAQAEAEQAAGVAPEATAAPASDMSASSAPATAAADSMTQTAATPQFDPIASALPGTAAVDSELAGIIYFAHGSAALDANDRRVLRGIVALNRERGGGILVVGHASAFTGTINALEHRLANFEISLKRANAVMAELVALGLPHDRVRVEARGDSQPIYHEFMPTGEAGNRRAEIFLEH